jgi:hypothetical protein
MSSFLQSFQEEDCDMPRTRRATSRPEPAGTSQEEARRSKQARQAEREIIVTLRLPRELHARLKELGGERGLTAQIRERLEASLTIDEAWEDPLFADLMRTVGHVIVAAGQLYSSDPDSYSIIELAIRLLLDAFRPDSAPDIIHEVYIPTTVEMLAKVERLVGVALGALGERGIAKAARVRFLNVTAEAERRGEEEENKA